MSWRDKMKEYGGGDFTFLSEDGETIKFIIAGEPELLKGEYKKQLSKRVACPVVTEDGFTIFIVGMRLFRRIAKREDRHADSVFMAIRHGGSNDPNATYDLQIVDDNELLTRLRHIKDSEVNPQILADAMKDAKEFIEKS